MMLSVSISFAVILLVVVIERARLEIVRRIDALARVVVRREDNQPTPLDVHELRSEVRKVCEVSDQQQRQIDEVRKAIEEMRERNAYR